MTVPHTLLAFFSLLLSVLGFGLFTPLGAPAAYGLALLIALVVGLISYVVANREDRRA